MQDNHIQMEFERKQKEQQEYYLKLALQGKLKLSHLRNMPTLHQGHFNNVKHEDKNYKICLSRMTIADGMSYNNQVTVEKLIKGNWETIKEFEAK